MEEVQQLIRWRRQIEDLWGIWGLLPLVGAREPALRDAPEDKRVQGERLREASPDADAARRRK